MKLCSWNNAEGQEGIGMKLLHHSYSTNGVRPPVPPNGGRLIGFACAALVLAAGGMALAALPVRVAIVYSDWSKRAFAT